MSLPPTPDTIQTNNQRQNFLYSRVSSKKQLDDLSRQIEFLRQWERDRTRVDSFELISDIGSGINFKRKGIQTILDACLSRTIGSVVIAHRDRLSIFGFELIQSIIEKAGGNVIVLDDHDNKSSEQELAEDLLSIVQIFTCKQMGKRRYKHSKEKEQEIETGTE